MDDIHVLIQIWSHLLEIWHFNPNYMFLAISSMKTTWYLILFWILQSGLCPYHVCAHHVLWVYLTNRKLSKCSNTRSTRPLWSHQAHFTRWNYVTTFMYVFSRFTWIIDTLKADKEFKSSAETSELKILSLRSDRGGKYLSKDFTCFMQRTWHTISLGSWSSCRILPLYWHTINHPLPDMVRSLSNLYDT